MPGLPPDLESHWTDWTSSRHRYSILPGSPIKAKKSALNACHLAAIAFLTQSRSLIENKSIVPHQQSNWACDSLDCVVDQLSFLFFEAQRVGVARRLFEPSTDDLRVIQARAATQDSDRAAGLEKRFKELDLPICGFPGSVDISDLVPKSVWIPNLVFCSVLMVTFLVLIFLKERLTNDQRHIAYMLFSLLAGLVTNYMTGQAFLMFRIPASSTVRFSFSATAGIAIMVLCWLVKPYWYDSISSSSPTKPPSKAVVNVIDDLAVQEDIQARICGKIQSFADYLNSVCPDLTIPPVTIHLRENGIQDIGVYLFEERTILLGKPALLDDDVILVEYCHHALLSKWPRVMLRANSAPNGPFELGSIYGSIVRYLPASYNNDPIVSKVYGSRIFPNEGYIFRLSDLNIGFAKKDRIRDTAGYGVWCSVLWELRQAFSQNVMDRMLLETWRGLDDSETDPDVAEFISRLKMHINESVGPNGSDVFQAVLKRRGYSSQQLTSDNNLP